jgi:large subunit ribosomal protein L22
MKAHLNGISVSSKKANIIAGLIRGKSVDEALEILKFTPKKAAKLILKVVTSASANAVHNDGKKQENLKIGQIIVNRGSFNKRFLASTRGRALRIHKPTAHITVELTDK